MEYLDNYLALAVLQLRDQSGDTQNAVADRTNKITANYIGKIERREVYNMKLHTLEELSLGLGIELSELVKIAEELRRKDQKYRKKE